MIQTQEIMIQTLAVYIYHRVFGILKQIMKLAKVLVPDIKIAGPVV
jgi:hypothetical protein